MAIEPIDPVVPTPRGGWPKVCFCVDLTPPCSLDEAVYAVASLSRAIRHGVATQIDGYPLYAWPHQSVSEIARTHAGMRRMEDRAMEDRARA